MKYTARMAWSRWARWLLALVLLIGLTVPPGYAEESSLVPEDLEYEDGNIILHKHAERIGADEWKVVVRATVGEQPVEKRKIEVVFVLDCSGSMAWCTDESVHEAGSHTHSDSCYGLECTQHTHSIDAGCYSTERCTSSNNPSHWEGWIIKTHKAGTDCLKVTSNLWSTYYYPLICTQAGHTHSQAAGCYVMNCGRDECTHASSGATACTYVDESGNNVAYKSRLEAAKECIASMVSHLTANGDDNVIFKYVIFSSAGSSYDNGVNKGSNESTKVVSSFANVTAEGGTYMYTGIKTGINQFSDNEYKKVLVVLTDGAANDDASVSSSELEKFKDPNQTDGIVYTVGFAYANDTLASIAGNGGSYVHAGDTIELTNAFDRMEQTLTAMLEDPMGTSVGFDKTSIEISETTSGVVSTNDNTIFWNPAEDDTDIVRNSTVEFSYTVKLNDEANMDAGDHSVQLNSPTYFRYGLTDSDGTPAQMKEAQFPIPTAEYKVSSIQTRWQSGGEDIQDALAVEKLVCDYASADFIPAFEQDYRTITPIIPIEGSSDYYRYTGTMVTANGTALASVDEVDPANPVNYVVIHQYERVNANELAISGTKTLVGRDFGAGDSFTFTLTGSDGAPKPEKTSVTIEPTSGASAVFSFGNVTFTEAGNYTYTIQEELGSLANVIYDTAVHTMNVTAVEENGSIVVSYTLDGVENGALTVNNRLETGSLKVEKTKVNSHVEAHQAQTFSFLIHVLDRSGRGLNGECKATLKGVEQLLTFSNGYAAVKLKAGESAVIEDIPDGATYTVTEDAVGGFTVTATGDTGSVKAKAQSVANFENSYHSAGSYQFRANKSLVDATLQLDQFSFKVLHNGEVVATGKNNTDGSIAFDTLHFTEADIGAKEYTVVEDIGTEANIAYDRTEHRVTLTIADQGDGTLKITDDLTSPMLFTNRYVENQLVVSKTVAGNIGSRNKEFSFSIALPNATEVKVSTDGGASFTEMTLNAQGEYPFTLRHGESIIFSPMQGTYTVTEETAEGYTTTYQVDQADPVTGNTVNGTVGTEGCQVAFTNTLDIPPPTGVHDSLGGAVAGLCLAAALWMIKRMGGGCAQNE